MRARGVAGARRPAPVLSWLAAAALAGCPAAPRVDGADTPPPADPPAHAPDADARQAEPPGEPPLPSACADVYAESLLPTFEVEISEAGWAALQQDALLGREDYHPVVFRSGADVVRDAMIRLRGNNSRCGDKLQFAISFDRVDRGGRYHGLRRVNLDHGGCNLLEERLALSFLRDLGLPAACANHARLVVNGRYYGLFVNVEHLNEDFLRRNFGRAADDGNLYKSGRSLRTNERVRDTSDLAAYAAAADVTTLASLVDLDEAVLEWAAEAVLPARDNYWLQGYNYYLYHHPTRGFLFLPTDLDQAFPATSADVSLATLLPEAPRRPADLVLDDPAWRARYEEAVRRVAGAYDAAALAARLDGWWRQIATAAHEDPFAPYSAAEVRALEARIRGRAEWLRAAVADPSSW